QPAALLVTYSVLLTPPGSGFATRIGREINSADIGGPATWRRVIGPSDFHGMSSAAMRSNDTTSSSEPASSKSRHSVLSTPTTFMSRKVNSASRRTIGPSETTVSLAPAWTQFDASL